MPRLLVTMVCIFASAMVHAQMGIDAFAVTTAEDGTQTYTLTLQILILMTALTLLPALILAMTSFTRIIIVLAILRQAIGTAQTPSSQVLLGLALFLTMFIMAPVFEQVFDDSITPYLADEIDISEALKLGAPPLREFMLGQTRESDLVLFSELSGDDVPDSADDLAMSILIPAFVTSELKTAFQIGFLIFIPFLVIDLVVASVLMSMGMMMLSPLIISLPFKIMLFVLVDGWALIIGTLAASFYV